MIIFNKCHLRTTYCDHFQHGSCTIYDVIIVPKENTLIMLVTNTNNYHFLHVSKCHLWCDFWMILNVILKILHMGQDGRDQYWSLSPGGGWTIILRCTRYLWKLFKASVFKNLLESICDETNFAENVGKKNIRILSIFIQIFQITVVNI